MQHVKAGFIGGKPGAFDFHAAESADIDVAIGFATPWATPMFHLHQFLGAMRNEVIDDVLFAQPVAAGHRIVKMMLQAVVRLYHAGGTAFGRHRVAAHRVDLGNERDGQRRIGFSHRNGRAKPGTACTDDGYVSLENFH